MTLVTRGKCEKMFFFVFMCPGNTGKLFANFNFAMTLASIYQLLDEVEQNIVICQWREDQLFADAEGRGK